MHWRVYRGGLIRVGWGIKEGKGSRRVGRAVEVRELFHSLLISYSLAFIPNFPFNLFLFGRLVSLWCPGFGSVKILPITQKSFFRQTWKLDTGRQINLCNIADSTLRPCSLTQTLLVKILKCWFFSTPL